MNSMYLIARRTGDIEMYHVGERPDLPHQWTGDWRDAAKFDVYNLPHVKPGQYVVELEPVHDGVPFPGFYKIKGPVDVRSLLQDLEETLDALWLYQKEEEGVVDTARRCRQQNRVLRSLISEIIEVEKPKRKEAPDGLPSWVEYTGEPLPAYTKLLGKNKNWSGVIELYVNVNQEIERADTMEKLGENYPDFILIYGGEKS